MIDIKDFYESKLADLQSIHDELCRKDKLFSTWRLIIFFAGALFIYYTLYSKALPVPFSIFPIGVFLYLLNRHQKLLVRKRSAESQKIFVERALARINGDWQGKSMTSDHYLSEKHLFDNDLDIFGEASLFDYLATCPTRLGGDWLKATLINKSSTQEIQERQKLIKALKNYPELNLKLSEFSQVKVAEASLYGQTLDWSLQSKKLDNIALKALCLVLGTSCFSLLILWFFFQWPLYYALINLALNYTLLSIYRKNLDEAVAGLQETVGMILPLSASLKVLDEAELQEDELKSLQNGININSLSAWQWIVYLDKALQSYENLKSNAATQPLNIIFLLEFFTCSKIERWRNICGNKIEDWVNTAAKFEGLNALSLFAFENPDYCFPDFTEEKTFTAKGLKHPLISHDKVVSNDISISEDKNSLILISGSNMAGKSTFLRSIGINIVLAQAGAPCAAESVRLSRFNLACSIRIDDSLKDGISHFYAEVLRLKQIHDLVKKSEEPVLFFFDEILHGTNSYDRLIGAGAVIKTLVKDGGLGLVTTHDLALTEIADELDEKARKICFVDHIEDEKMLFDYKIHDGVASRGNAVRLMQLQGLDI